MAEYKTMKISLSQFIGISNSSGSLKKKVLLCVLIWNEFIPYNSKAQANKERVPSDL